MQGTNPEKWLIEREMSRMSLAMKPENFQPGVSQRREKRPLAKAIRFPDQWGKTSDDRDQQWREWRHLALQGLQQSDCKAFRVVAILQDLFDWDAREVSSTDQGFADAAGYCSVKTIARELSELRRLGFIISERKWHERADGKMVKGRRIIPAIPSTPSALNNF